MIPTKDALQATAQDIVPEILAELNYLILGPVAIPQVSRLGCP